MQQETKTAADKLLYILFYILMENNIFIFFTEIFVKNFINHLKKKKSVKKRLNILFSVLMENNILLVYIYSIFRLGIFHHVRHMYIYIYLANCFISCTQCRKLVSIGYTLFWVQNRV